MAAPGSCALGWAKPAPVWMGETSGKEGGGNEGVE